ncbi:MAG: HAMP domain-containing histidine kinase [Planctomycetaceae bacterium]|nr:HAMP domain-containing histidine kinase [Planctomycetaceae bacterium]MCB9953547.1 HAMP domain-containing histidine kinase [Planctomycetaceae bacterium]
MRRFPPVAVLLRSCLPFHNPQHMLEKFAAAWCEVTGCTEVRVARWDETVSQIDFFERVNGEEWDEFHSRRFWKPVVGGIDTAREMVADEFQTSGAQWQLIAAERIVGWLHLSGTAGTTAPPHEWLDQSARLLIQAGGWEESLRQQKLSALREYAAGAGHEINNPLAAISGRVQQLLQGEENPERRRMLQTIGAQTMRIRDMIGDSMLFADPPCPEKTNVSWWDTWNLVAKRFSDQLAEKALRVICDGDDVTLLADPVQLEIVCSELLRNSINEGGKGQQIECLVVSATGDFAHIVIRDHGQGLTEEVREHLFDPFFSGREAGRGLGFGLSKAWQIARQHGGQLTCHTPSAETVEMHLHWPLTN